MATNTIVRLIAPSRSASSRFLEPVSRFLSSVTPPPPQSPSPSPNEDQIVKPDENLQMRKEEEEEEEGGGEFVNEDTGEIGGPRGPEPTRYGDWEQRGRCSDF